MLIGVFIYGGADINLIHYKDLEQAKRNARNIYENGKNFDPEVDSFLVFQDKGINTDMECIFNYEQDEWGEGR